VKIGILGSGNIGGTLGKKWAQAGHDVVFGVREVNSAKVGALLEAAGGNASADSVANAAAFGDVILIAIPWSAAGAMVEATSITTHAATAYAASVLTTPRRRNSRRCSLTQPPNRCAARFKISHDRSVSL